MEEIEKQEIENQETEKQEDKRQEFDKQKLLDILDIDKMNQQFENKKEVVLQVEYQGKVYDAVVYIDKVFSPTKMKTCASEFINQLRHARIFKVAFDASMYEIYMLFLIVKHFSSLELPFRLEKQIEVLYKMVDTRILFSIFQEFDENEIEKMNYELHDVIQRIDVKADAFETFLEEADLENANLLKAKE